MIQGLSSESDRNVLILGSGGQLGTELHKIFPDAIAYDHSSGGAISLDFLDTSKLEAAILSSSCVWMINAAAFTNVDASESNKERAYRINGLAVKSIVRAARKIDARVLQISTDYIFDGSRSLYLEDDIPKPLNFYGLSKLTGEIYANGYEDSLIVRTSGVYGSKKNFPNFIFSQLSSGKEANVLEGYYSPIHAKNLAKAIKILIQKRETGIINVAGERTSRFNLAVEIAKKFNLDKHLINKVDRIDSMKALRPFDSSLDISKAKQILNFDFYSYESNLKCFEESTIMS